MDLLENCNLCPRKCGVNRYEKAGFCGAGAGVRVARAALHYMEEPCISGVTDMSSQPKEDSFIKAGSGAIFFSGCNLKCCYCQNYKLSHNHYGADISVERLAGIFIELQQKGANNINLVTAVMYVPQIIEALELVKGSLTIPVVYNSSGYENIETIRLLEDYIDIYLVDIKYYSNAPAVKYSVADNYFEYAVMATQEMLRQKGEPVFYEGKGFDDENALLKSGVIIRHLVLPSMRRDSVEILRYIAKSFDRRHYILSLMSQFTPGYRACEHKEINRRVTSFEYDSVVKEALRLGLYNTYIQDRDSAGSEYTPEFNLEGIITNE